MALKRCDADLHFYDPEKHESCPYCRIQSGDADETVAYSGGAGSPAAIPAGEGVTTVGYTEAGDETESFGIGESSTSAYMGSTQYVTPGDGVEPEGVTVGVFRKKASFSPVVGWLVNVDGKERGKDYRIRPGINLVGRSDASDIVVKDDDTISRVEHAEIEYDPEDNTFYLLRKKNPEVRLNGTKIREPKKLSAYDVIQLGETVFLFIPFCSESFKWTVE